MMIICKVKKAENCRLLRIPRSEMMSHSHSRPHHIIDMHLQERIRQCPNRYFGYLAYTTAGLFRVTGYDDHIDIRELVGCPCHVEKREVVLHENECEHCIDPNEVLCFITPDTETEFVRRYETDSPEEVQAWLSGEYSSLGDFALSHPQHVRVDNDDGSFTFMPVNQQDSVYVLKTNEEGRYEIVSET